MPSALDKYRKGAAPSAPPGASALDKYRRTTPAPAPTPVAAAPPERSLLGTVKDVGIGAAKGVADTVMGPLALAPVIERIADVTYNRRSFANRPRDINLPADIPLDPAAPRREPAVAETAPEPTPDPVSDFLGQFESSNTAQSAGKVLEFLATLGGPRLVPRAPIARLPGEIVEGSKKVGPALARRTDTGGQMTGPLPAGQTPLRVNTPARPPAPRISTGTGSTVGAPPAGQMPLRIVGQSPTPSSQGFSLRVNAPAAAREAAQEPALAQRAAGTVELPGSTTAATQGGKVAEQLVAAGQPDKAAERIVLSAPEVYADFRRAFGSERAGSMLRPDLPRSQATAEVRRLAPGPSRRPLQAEMDDLDRAFRRLIDDERGALNPRAAATVGLGTAGAAIGGTQGDTTEERVMYAGLGLALGTAIGAMGPQSFVINSILSNPASVAKAYMGAFGGAAFGAMELASRNPKAAKAVVRELLPDRFFPRFVQAFRKNDPLAARLGRVGPITDAGTDDQVRLLGRVYRAADVAAKAAMEKGGISIEDAARLTLSGTPTSSMGSQLLTLLSGDDSARFIVRMLTTFFPRVGIQIVERGLERMVPPAVARRMGVATAHGQQAGKALPALGAGAAAAGFATEGSEMPDWLKPFVAAATGPYALPVSIGMAAKAALDKRDPAPLLEAFGEEIPLARFGPTEALKQFTTGAPLVPNLVAGAARAADPYERQTAGQGFFARTKARIPGLRETLPVRGQQVSIAGKPVEPRTGLQRFVTGARPQADPLKGIPARVKAEIERFEIDINPPAYEKDIEIGKRKIPVPPDLAERRRAEARELLIPQVEKLLSTPSYQRASDEQKKRRLQAVVDRARSAGAKRARARVIRTLRESGALRAGRPSDAR